MTIFSKNCVLAGQLDYYCLICAEQLKHEEDTLEHILHKDHKDKLKTCGYFDKFKEHFIRKVGGIYFCEPCSQTFPTATKVGLHVEDPAHIREKNKSKQWLKRVEDDIVAFEQFLITDDAWNGIAEDTCVICNAEFDDIASHTGSNNHILNLIKSKVIFDDSTKAVYRSIDAKCNQCLICNMVFGEDLTDHVKASAHKSSFKTPDVNCNSKTNVNNNVNRERNISEKQKNTKVDDSARSVKRESKDSPKEYLSSKHHQTLLKMNKEKIANESKNSDSKPQLFELVENYQNNNINIDLINETAVCKKCSQNIEFNIDAIERHIEGHKHIPSKKSMEKVTPFATGMKSNGNEKTTLYTKPVIRAAGKDKSRSQPLHSATEVMEVEDYAKQHGLSHNRADNSFYCNLCCRRLPTTLEDLNKHVNSKSHKENIDKQTSKQKLSSQPVKIKITEFVHTLEVKETMTGIDMVINDKYWINAFGFVLIAKFKNIIFCEVCDIDLTPENVMDHIILENHVSKLEKCLIISSLDDEFVREIKLDVYHCGFCNRVEYDWKDILEHLTMEEHKAKKMEAQRRIRNHKPNPYRRVRAEEMGSMFGSFMEQHMRPFK